MSALQFCLVCVEDTYLLKGVKTFFSLLIYSSQKECVCLFTCVSLQSFHLSSPARHLFQLWKTQICRVMEEIICVHAHFRISAEKNNTLPAFPKSHKIVFAWQRQDRAPPTHLSDAVSLVVYLLFSGSKNQNKSRWKPIMTVMATLTTDKERT